MEIKPEGSQRALEQLVSYADLYGWGDAELSRTDDDNNNNELDLDIIFRHKIVDPLEKIRIPSDENNSVKVSTDIKVPLDQVERYCNVLEQNVNQYIGIASPEEVDDFFAAKTTSNELEALQRFRYEHINYSVKRSVEDVGIEKLRKFQELVVTNVSKLSPGREIEGEIDLLLVDPSNATCYFAVSSRLLEHVSVKAVFSTKEKMVLCHDTLRMNACLIDEWIDNRKTRARRILFSFSFHELILSKPDLKTFMDRIQRKVAPGGSIWIAHNKSGVNTPLFSIVTISSRKGYYNRCVVCRSDGKAYGYSMIPLSDIDSYTPFGFVVREMSLAELGPGLDMLEADLGVLEIRNTAVTLERFSVEYVKKHVRPKSGIFLPIVQYVGRKDINCITAETKIMHLPLGTMAHFSFSAGEDGVCYVEMHDGRLAQGGPEVLVFSSPKLKTNKDYLEGMAGHVFIGVACMSFPDGWTGDYVTAYYDGMKMFIVIFDIFIPNLGYSKRSALLQALFFKDWEYPYEQRPNSLLHHYARRGYQNIILHPWEKIFYGLWNWDPSVEQRPIEGLRHTVTGDQKLTMASECALIRYRAIEPTGRVTCYDMETHSWRCMSSTIESALIQDVPPNVQNFYLGKFYRDIPEAMDYDTAVCLYEALVQLNEGNFEPCNVDKTFNCSPNVQMLLTDNRIESYLIRSYPRPLRWEASEQERQKLYDMRMLLMRDRIFSEKSKAIKEFSDWFDKFSTETIREINQPTVRIKSSELMIQQEMNSYVKKIKASTPTGSTFSVRIITEK